MKLQFVVCPQTLAN